MFAPAVQRVPAVAARNHSKPLALAAILALVPVLSMATTAGAAVKTKAAAKSKTASIVSRTPSQILAAARAATLSEAAVDWKGTEQAGHLLVSVATQAGRVDGLQTVTFYKPAAAGKPAVAVGQVSEVRFGKILYVEGNEIGLNHVDFRSCAAQAEAGKWIAVTSSQNLYSRIAVDMSVSTTSQLLLSLATPMTKVGTSKVQGYSVVGIRGAVVLSGKTKVQRVLYVRTSGLPLPVEYVQSTGVVSNAVFGPWGKAPKVQVPANPERYNQAWIAGSTVPGAC